MIQEDSQIKVRVHVQLTGRVQGVGFRAFVLELAERSSLDGWVRNLGYDQLEAVAEGPREKLEWFAEKIKAGPLGGRVDQVSIDWETGSGEFKGFMVRSSR